MVDLFKKNSISFLAFYLVSFALSDSGAAIGEDAGPGGFKRAGTIKRLEKLAGTANSSHAKKTALREAGVPKDEIDKAEQMDASFTVDSGVDSESDSEPSTPVRKKKGLRKDPYKEVAEKYFKSTKYRESIEKNAENAALEFGVFGLAHLNAARDPQVEFLRNAGTRKKFQNRTLDVDKVLFPSLQTLSVREDLEDSRGLFEEQLKEKEALVQRYKNGEFADANFEEGKYQEKNGLERFLEEAYDLEGRGLIEKVKAKREKLLEQFNASQITAKQLFTDLIALEGEKIATARMERLSQNSMAGPKQDSIEQESLTLAQKYGQLQYAVGGLYDLMYAALSEEGRKAISGGERVYDSFVSSKKFQAAKAWFRMKTGRDKERESLLGIFNRTQKNFLENLEVLRKSDDEIARTQAKQKLAKLRVDPALIEELSDVTKTPDLKKGVRKLFRHLGKENKRLGMLKDIFKEHARDKGSRAIRQEAKEKMIRYFQSLERIIDTYKAERQQSSEVN